MWDELRLVEELSLIPPASMRVAKGKEKKKVGD
jgi:hypothetical protein